MSSFNTYRRVGEQKRESLPRFPVCRFTLRCFAGETSPLTVATCKHRDFRPRLIDNILGLKPTLFCQQPRLSANSLQTSGPTQIICKRLSGCGRTGAQPICIPHPTVVSVRLTRSKLGNPDLDFCNRFFGPKNRGFRQFQGNGGVVRKNGRFLGPTVRRIAANACRELLALQSSPGCTPIAAVSWRRSERQLYSVSGPSLWQS
jgi:hypothetical protein